MNKLKAHIITLAIILGILILAATVIYCSYIYGTLGFSISMIIILVVFGYAAIYDLLSSR